MNTLLPDTLSLPGSPARTVAGLCALALILRDDSRREADKGAVNSEDASDIGASLNGDGQAYARLVRRYQDQIATRVGYRYWKDRRRREPLTGLPLQGWAEMLVAPEAALSPRQAAEGLHRLLEQLPSRRRR